jgi:hypothetical protein
MKGSCLGSWDCGFVLLAGFVGKLRGFTYICVKFEKMLLI